MQKVENALYWVMVRLIAQNNISYDWALGYVREGHFEWLNRYEFDGRLGMPTGCQLHKTTLEELLRLQVPMIKVEKPDIRKYMKKIEPNYLGENI